MKDLENLKSILDRIEHQETPAAIRKELEDKSLEKQKRIERQWHNRLHWKLLLAALTALSIAAVFLIQRSMVDQEQLRTFDFVARTLILFLSGLGPVLLLSQEPFHQNLPDEAPFAIRLKLPGKLVGIAYVLTIALNAAHLGVNEQIQQKQDTDMRAQLETFLDRLDKAKQQIDEIASITRSLQGLKDHVTQEEKSTRDTLHRDFAEQRAQLDTIENQVSSLMRSLDATNRRVADLRDSTRNVDESIGLLELRTGAIRAQNEAFIAGLAETRKLTDSDRQRLDTLVNKIEGTDESSLASRIAKLDGTGSDSLASRVAKLATTVHDLPSTISDVRQELTRLHDQKVTRLCGAVDELRATAAGSGGGTPSICN